MKSSKKGCCYSKAGQEVRDEFKKELARKKRIGSIRANNAGCLGHCKVGVVVVVYPEQIWYQGVQVSDVEEIVQRHLIEGEPVKRLLMKPSDLPVV